MDAIAKDYQFFKKQFHPEEELKQDKKFHPVLDQELLQKRCPQCGSSNSQENKGNYTCFKCGKIFPFNNAGCIVIKPE